MKIEDNKTILNMDLNEFIIIRKSKISRKTFEALKEYMERNFQVKAHFMPDVEVFETETSCINSSETPIRTNIVWCNGLGKGPWGISNLQLVAKSFVDGYVTCRRGSINEYSHRTHL